MKKHQRGSAALIALAVVGVLVVLIGLAIAMFISANNTAAAFDSTIKAQHQNNKNIMAQYNQKVLEAAQVPEMMRDDIIKVANAAIQGRYGPDGSKAVFQALTEANPHVDSQVYLKIQQIIEAGRNEFQRSQTLLLDRKATYETALNSLPTGAIMRMMGYPRVPLDTYNIVTTDRTEKVFKDGKEEAPLQLRRP